LGDLPVTGRQQARLQRYRHICQAVRLHPLDRVLDVGCGSGDSLEAFNQQNEIVGLDLAPEPRIHQPNFRYVQGDARDMRQFADGEFDVAFAVGLMEHIPPEDLQAVADEIRRVSRRYAVVIPHIWTLIEPHYRLPLWQFYPHAVRSSLVSRFRIGPYPKSPSGEYRHLNYFTPGRWRGLFPGSRTAVHNHIGWLVRDLIIYGESAPSPARVSSATAAV
jgi:SAM-dependent methyltransferase